MDEKPDEKCRDLPGTSGTGRQQKRTTWLLKEK
jgi:hypothetical protein